jgi:hypothetical protein
MDPYFDAMLRRLRLTKLQRKDARTKYTRVAKLLHSEFYDTEYNGKTKLLIGSYGKKTNICPPHDVDLLFKIPSEVLAQYQNYEGNGASALLQRVRDILSQTYTTTDKISAWGKVVLVQFADGTHNVEVLPGYDADGVFIIPNSEDGGSWESFDAHADLNLVAESHARTGGKARKLIRIIKKWRKLHSSMKMKSYEIEQQCVQFLDQADHGDESWSELICAFFKYLSEIANGDDRSQIETACAHATKARECELTEKIEEACIEWRKIFGDAFPAYTKTLNTINKLSNEFPSEKEEFIEDYHRVRLNPLYWVKISAIVSHKKFRNHSISEFLRNFGPLLKIMSLDFSVTTNVPGDVDYYWKVRNFGRQAKEAVGLRGEITHTGNIARKHESTLYCGTHYVECYVIQNAICVAKSLLFVPISDRVAED